MKPSLLAKLDQLDQRLEEVGRLLASPEATADMDQYRKLNREHAEIEPVVAGYRDYRRTEADLAGAREMLADPEMKELAEQEIEDAKARLAGLADQLQILLLPRDPNDERNIFLEIRAGTGGDESALFAGDLFRMYARYAERRRWKLEVMSASEGEVGGYKEVICRIVGQGAYSKLKFE
ncbi:MAG: PCRF domain-containing protein, partial [Thiobacillus sp.]|nr:PCRF domain-containing protein [Thiobacillus sp.]